LSNFAVYGENLQNRIETRVIRPRIFIGFRTEEMKRMEEIIYSFIVKSELNL